MAGRPRYRAMVAEIERRARDYFEVEDGEASPSHVDYAVAWIESGGTLALLADEIATERMIEVTREQVSRYLNGAEGQEGSERLARARTRGAHGVAESRLLDLDRAATEEDSRMAERKNRAGQWLAERWNRDEFGKAPEVAIAISAGDLYLDALKRSPSRQDALPGSTSPALPDVRPEVEDASEVTVTEGS